MRLATASLGISILANVLIGPAGAAPTAPPPFWGKLAEGPFVVGFRSLWQLDYSRVYNTVFDDKTAHAVGKAPRPILINIWYPAERSDDIEPMAHRDYLKIQTEDPRLARFAAKLADFERGIVCKEVMGKAISELTDDERKHFERFWKTPTACRRDAPPLDARFPLVIYHSGAQSSFEDNSVFCEFLASHGYVVVGSAFQEVTGQTLAVDGRDGSARDFEFLIAHARRQPNVEWNHIGLVGHSLGAQAILWFRAQPASPVDAVVSLDSTIDYRPLTAPGGQDVSRRLLDNSRYVNGPMLMIANANALFQLGDSLKHAERYYFTLTDHDHNDFIDQGIQRRARESDAKPGDRAVRLAFESARASYESVCEYVLNFFDVYLKNQSARRRELATRFRQTRFGGDQPHVEYLPAGATVPEPYQDEVTVPPTLRQIRPLIAVRGIDATVALLKKWHEREPGAPVLQKDLGFAVVDECLGYGQVGEAIAIRRFFSSLDPKFSRIFVKEGDAWRRAGLNAFAVDYYKKACLLDPTDAEAAARLKELSELK
jgi:pimeloyl-ACP methyl ester carboxylesterase